MWLSGAVVLDSQKQNEKIVREIYRALSEGDYGKYFSLLSDDIVYYAAGDCQVSGIHKGKEELKRMGTLTFEETQGTHRVELKSLSATNTYVAAIDIWKASRNGNSIQMENLLVYKLKNGKVTEIREFIENEKLHDEFWR